MKDKKIGDTLQCPYCNSLFNKLLAHQSYCTRRCRILDQYKREREAHKRAMIPKECIVCETIFVPNTRGHIYCTPTCNQRANLIKRFYGSTIETILDLFSQQNKSCGICNKEVKTWLTLNIDHCHKTGKVRGLLCDSCNFMLGHAFDNPDILKKGIDYLCV